jgi:trehalose 6-phosphate phosphatase
LSEMGEELRSALTAFAARHRVLVAVDFDGTLAPFVTDPLQARALHGGLEALRDAATLSGVTTAVVSGRDLATLEMLTAIGPDDGITLIGSHGAQTNRPDEAGRASAVGASSLDEAGRASAVGASSLDEAAAALLETLRDELEAIRSRYPAVRLEHKTAAVVLHTRDVEPSAAEAATIAAHEAGRRHTGAHVTPGKEVVELSVSAADKGSALAELARASSSEATLYVGDDATDERAFAALHPPSGDLTIKVGPGETGALHRLPNPEAVVELLQLFVELRRLQG